MNTKQLILEKTLKLMIEKQNSQYIIIFLIKKRYIMRLLKDTI